MVTQIYTAPLKAYTPNSQFGLSSPLGAQKKQDNPLTGDEDPSQGQSNMLAAVKEQSQKGVISIHSVISDFQNTMDALGVTPEVRQDVSPYLQVIAHQAQMPQPVAGLMKQN